jgi:hypothetical protein
MCYFSLCKIFLKNIFSDLIFFNNRFKNFPSFSLRERKDTQPFLSSKFVLNIFISYLTKPRRYSVTAFFEAEDKDTITIYFLQMICVNFRISFSTKRYNALPACACMRFILSVNCSLLN